VYFNPPATNTSTPLTYQYVASGTCSGTLDGRDITNQPVILRDSGSAQGSCAQAYTTAPGEAQLTFSNGPTIYSTLDFSSVATVVTFTLYGQRSGTADGHGTFATQRTPPDVTLQCAGPGAAQVPMDFSLSTESPLTSLTIDTDGLTAFDEGHRRST
jgi:hypothetical protein